MKAFLRGLLWGTIGTVVVLGLAIGVCYFSGLLDFAGGEREALSSSVQSTGFAVVGREAEGRAQEQEKPSAAPQEPLEAEVSLEPKEAKGEEIRLLFAGDLYLTELLQDKYRKNGIQAAATEELLRLLRGADLFILNQEFPFGTTGEAMEEKEYTFPEAEDKALLEIAEEVCGKDLIGSIFLIGDGFQEDWMKESLRFLCRGRRVFQGNNLFSKGACCGMQEKIAPSEQGRNHVFLGNEKLKANIGMQVLQNGQESYYPLLDAGVSWYEAQRELEVYLQDGNELMLTVLPLIRSNSSRAGKASGRDGEAIRVVLEGLSEGIVRLKLHFYMKTERCLVVEAEDLGFGEFRASSGRTWKDEIQIYQETDRWGEKG